ncbi:hypothetical protein EYF80_001864 [Liparis tanakae]|uniref:Uncharacterized protein n=1 Tax=Liparis tanakae TaxID=230148 RepID=A0A4Z2JCK8_9TELE|nr:hypothetical protein EYF80_001864 [Liparis tanakae]
MSARKKKPPHPPRSPISTAAFSDRSESAEPGLDPVGERNPGLDADMGLEPVWGLEPAIERGQMHELEEGRLAEPGRL